MPAAGHFKETLVVGVTNPVLSEAGGKIKITYLANVPPEVVKEIA